MRSVSTRIPPNPAWYPAIRDHAACILTLVQLQVLHNCQIAGGTPLHLNEMTRVIITRQIGNKENKRQRPRFEAHVKQEHGNYITRVLENYKFNFLFAWHLQDYTSITAFVKHTML